MNTLPSGTVTFLFTDIEGSTKLAQEHPEVWESWRERHHAILRSAIESQHGYVFQIIGDAFCASFHTVGAALQAAINIQRRLQVEEWGNAPIRVRMGLHTGPAEVRDTDYRGYLTLARVQRVMSVAHGGQILISGSSAALVRGELPEGVSLLDMREHHLKGLVNLEHLWQAGSADLPSDFPPLQSLNDIPSNLPVQLTSFIGREKEIEEIRQAISKHRLVTLTGSGGTGKTRLSLQVAAEILNRFKDGVWFVELAPITDPARVPNTVASILGIREEPSRPLMTTLMDWFSGRDLLILLDNCEHLLDACARFTDSVLRGSRETHILASSREALGIAGEIAYRVPSLPTPSPDQHVEIERLEEYESVQLFIERATQTLPTFQVTSTTSPAVAQICHRLDGIPLAIELAAARVKVLSVEQIAQRLDDRFRLLTGGSRTAMPRQQTLRAMIDWSYQLLSDPERLLFRRLAVFVGGWTLEAAETVCIGEGIEAFDVLDLLTHLVDKSLVIVETSGKESRYRRLETIRQYAREKLFETDEAAQIRDRHLIYFRTLAEEAEFEIVNANQLVWLNRLDAEFDNVRAALEWSQQDRVEDGLRLGGAIWRFCLRYGYANELVDKLNRLLQHPQGAERTGVRAKTLYALSILAMWQGDSVRVRLLAEESYAIYRELGNQNGEAAGLFALGLGASRGDLKALSFLLQSLALYRSLGRKAEICEVLIVISRVSRDSAQRQAWLEEALALARERGDAITMAGALDNLGVLATDIGNFSQARSWLEESLALQQPLGAPGYVSTLQYLTEMATYEGNYVEARAFCNEALTMSQNAGMTGHYLWLLSDLGYLALQEGNYVEAQNCFEESRELSEKIGNYMSALWARTHMAYAALRQGNTVYAKELFEFCILQFQKAGNIIGVVLTIEGLASLNVHQGQPKRAAQLFAWADAMRETLDDHRPPIEQASIEEDLAVIRSKMDNTIFAGLSVEGRKVTMEQAIALALET
jgi:predicted ATPase/class 3 adenylate cyclase